MSEIIICGYAATVQFINPKNVEFEFHPAAKLFPLPGPEDRAALKSSLVEHGFNSTTPIVVYADRNQIVDGRTRWMIEKELNRDQQIPVAFVSFPNDEAAKRFALSQNLGRRHLTREQRDQMINDLVFDGFAVKDLAEMFGISESAVTKITADARDLVEEERNKKIVALVDEGKTQRQAAEAVGVNPATVNRVLQKRTNSEIATDGSWLKKRPEGEIVKPTEIDPLKITAVDKSDDKIEKKVAKRVEQALKAERRKLDKEFDIKVREAADQFVERHILPVYGKRIELAETIIRSHKGVMSKSQYRRMLSCLHPDSTQDEEHKKKLAAVFDLVKSLEALLIEPKTAEFEALATTIEEFTATKRKAA